MNKKILDKNNKFRGLICDLDGVLWIKNAPAKGAVQFIDELRNYHIPFCILTNDCSTSKVKRLKALTEAGFKLSPEELITAPEITMNWLKNEGVKSILFLGNPEAINDISVDLEINNNTSVEAVVIGDLFSHYDRNLLDQAAKAIINGAVFVAIQRNSLWSDGVNCFIDNGFWVSGLEFVTGKKAFVTGKPNQNAYVYALESLGKLNGSNSNILFVSDDIISDLKGAKDLDLITAHFGSPVSLPKWVDYSTQNFKTLLSIIIRDQNA